MFQNVQPKKNQQLEVWQIDFKEKSTTEDYLVKMGGKQTPIVTD